MRMSDWSSDVCSSDVGLAAHARAGGDGERAGLDVADQHAALLQFDLRGAFDVAFQFAGDDHALGTHATGELGAGFDGQVALDVDVALAIGRASCGESVCQYV